MGEACRLDRDDIDLTAGVLTVTNSKFGKSRQIPVHASTVAALRGYARLRDQISPDRSRPPSFFVSTRGTRLQVGNVCARFTALARASGIPLPAGRRIRVHDLRHSFAVATLLDWYRASGDTQARLPLLTTYLGHVDPKSTYWYIQATPELLGLAAKRLEHHQGLQS